MFTAEVTSGMMSKELVPLYAFLGKKVRSLPNIIVDTRNDKVERVDPKRLNSFLCLLKLSISLVERIEDDKTVLTNIKNREYRLQK